MITLAVLNEAFDEYKKRALMGTLRFGQWFMNTRMPDVRDPELFYEENMDQAYLLIWANYCVD